MLRIFRIQGQSMQPALYAGDFVIVLTLWIRPQCGQLVLVKHPEYGIIVKRVHTVDDDNSVWLSSDNPQGVNTQQMGNIPLSQVIGRVIHSVHNLNTR